jgi:hypothetical protein
MVRPQSIAEVMGGVAILGRRVRSIADLEKVFPKASPSVRSALLWNASIRARARRAGRCSSSFPKQH